MCNRKDYCKEFELAVFVFLFMRKLIEIFPKQEARVLELLIGVKEYPCKPQTLDTQLGFLHVYNQFVGLVLVV